MNTQPIRNSPTHLEKLALSDGRAHNRLRTIAGTVAITIASLLGVKEGFDRFREKPPSASASGMTKLEQAEENQSIVNTWLDTNIHTPEGEKTIQYRLDLDNGALVLDLKDAKGNMQRWSLSSKQKTPSNVPLDSFIIQDVTLTKGPSGISTVCMYISPTDCIHIVDDKTLRSMPEELWKTDEDTYTMSCQYRSVPHGGLPGAKTIHDLISNNRAYNGSTIQLERQKTDRQESPAKHIAFGN